MADSNNSPIVLPTAQAAVNDYTTDKSIDNTQYAISNPTNQIIYTVGPDGQPTLNNPPSVIYTTDGTTTIPAVNTIVTNAVSSPPQSRFRMTKEFYIGIAAFIFLLMGITMVSASKSSRTGCFDDCGVADVVTNIVTGHDSDFLKCIDKCQSSYKTLKDIGIAFLVVGAVFLFGDLGLLYHNQQQQLLQQQIQNQQAMQQMQI